MTLTVGQLSIASIQQDNHSSEFFPEYSAVITGKGKSEKLITHCRIKCYSGDGDYFWKVYVDNSERQAEISSGIDKLKEMATEPKIKFHKKIWLKVKIFFLELKSDVTDPSHKTTKQTRECQKWLNDRHHKSIRRNQLSEACRQSVIALLYPTTR